MPPVELLALGSSLCYAVTLVLIRRGIERASPYAALVVVNTTVAILGLATAAWRGSLFSAGLEPILWFAAVGFIGQGLGTFTHFLGISRIGVSRSTPVQSTSPVWGTAIAILLLGESPSSWTVGGTLAIVAGVAVLAWPARGDGARWRNSGLVYPLLSSVFYAFVPVLAKLGFAHGSTPWLGIGVAFGTGSLSLLLGRRLAGGRFGGSPRVAATPLFLFAGLFNFVAASMFWNSLITGDVSVVLPISRLYPLWVLLLGWLFLGRLERITPRVGLGGLMIVAGGVVLTAF